jgi:hypothetical protein
MGEYDFMIVTLREKGKKREVTCRGRAEKCAVENYARSLFDGRPSKHAEMFRQGIDIEVVSSCYSAPKLYRVHVRIWPDGQAEFEAMVMDLVKQQITQEEVPHV